MMNETDTPNLDEGAYELLVAYLDGELDAEQNQLVERRLSEDNRFRLELQQLQFSWDLLDELPKAEASETFTQTTVEMVALSAERDWQQEGSRRQRFIQLRRVLLTGGIATAAAISFFVTSAFLARPNERLLKDLPVIENVDLYRVADSIEFLQQLEEEQLFSEEVDDGL
jgi:anti-sigma factor RsiW